MGKDVVLGQARFLRAYFYFELVKWFGDVPLVVDQRILFGQQFEVDRTPKTEVYAQIEQDLIYATSVLPFGSSRHRESYKRGSPVIIRKGLFVSR